MMQYIYDFLTILFDKLKNQKKIRNIILFGSFARGDQRKDSDIDVFIDVEEINKEEINSMVKEGLNEFEIKIAKSWKLKGIHNHISTIVDDINNERWNELRNELTAYGIVLYGRYDAPPRNKKQKILLEYNLSKIKQKDKMKVLRKLIGYKLKVGNKIYEQKGFIHELKADKISNSIILDIKEYKKVYDFLKQHKAHINIRRIWLD